ncbi:hypothetical protein J7I98_11925 [Streptomyces sp. ISL-98]|uniref:hypothetical protein n=1 Tax=Streptomyces sp. ISL-98 TaxID=2819192 RepID=UPI001BE9733E|nr:hypothetical protein [Streptomyces sp. ISL-98]MBT2506591.1 hypothetical protein [Streptomyces sp. ISL-98]
MRKFQQVALVVAAASGLSAIGAGPGFAAAPAAYNGAVPPPVGQQDAQAASWTSSQATAHSNGSPAPQRQAAPQQGADVSPQVNPQLSPQISPQVSPQSAPAPAQGGTPANQNNLFHPDQECSPQSLLNANAPVALLAGAETRGINCTQANSQSNALATAR